MRYLLCITILVMIFSINGKSDLNKFTIEHEALKKELIENLVNKGLMTKEEVASLVSKKQTTISDVADVKPPKLPKSFPKSPSQNKVPIEIIMKQVLETTKKESEWAAREAQASHERIHGKPKLTTTQSSAPSENLSEPDHIPENRSINHTTSSNHTHYYIIGLVVFSLIVCLFVRFIRIQSTNN